MAFSSSSRLSLAEWSPGSTTTATVTIAVATAAFETYCPVSFDLRYLSLNRLLRQNPFALESSSEVVQSPEDDYQFRVLDPRSFLLILVWNQVPRRLQIQSAECASQSSLGSHYLNAASGADTLRLGSDGKGGLFSRLKLAGIHPLAFRAIKYGKDVIQLYQLPSSRESVGWRTELPGIQKLPASCAEAWLGFGLVSVAAATRITSVVRSPSGKFVRFK